MSAFPESPFERLIEELRHQATVVSEIREVAEAPIREALQRFEEVSTEISRSIRTRWAPALAVVASELPGRGWYLTGQEPVTFIEQLANGIRSGEYDGVDELLLQYTADLSLRRDRLQDWLSQEGVPSYTIERTSLVLDEFQNDNHAVTTIVGIATIDELCRHLYDNRDFTTKGRSGPQRPQIALASPSSRRRISLFAKEFVQAFGMIHEDTDPARLEDVSYFNRSAIVHGRMRRRYGPLDSAKIVMILLFLACGAEPIVED